MAQHKRVNQKRPKATTTGEVPRRNRWEAVTQAAEPRAVVEYGPPFILLEDAQKNTFEYKAGNWVAHERSIAEVRLDCQVKELSQKVNKMTRYEVRAPLA